MILIALIFSDQTNYTVSLESQLSRVKLNRNVWLDLITKQQQATDPKDFTEKSIPPEMLATRRSEGSGDQLLNGSASTCDSVDKIARYSNSDDACCGLHPAVTFSSIIEALEWLSQGRDPLLTPMTSHDSPPQSTMPDVLRNADHIQVLCTGSLHLVGGVLGVLQPEICDD